MKNRSHCTVLKNAESTCRCVTSGVPRGTVLSPLLMILGYINNLPFSVSCNIRSFPDDCGIYRLNINANDSQFLQNHFWLISDWLGL